MNVIASAGWFLQVPVNFSSRKWGKVVFQLHIFKPSVRKSSALPTGLDVVGWQNT